MIQDLGVRYADNSVLLEPIDSDEVAPGQYVFLGDDGYFFHTSDTKRGIVARYLDDDGDVIECKMVGSKKRYKLGNVYQPQTAEDQTARIPRGKAAQVYALRQLFRK